MLSDFPKGFPAGYRERFAAHSAVVDMQHLLSLSEKNPLVMSFYQPLGQVSGQRELHCKLYHADTPLALSDVLPILEKPRPARAGRVPVPSAPHQWPRVLDS
nr:hypothetical protein GCM10020185_70090 [Pseudomonas brassicacearum subsp. brassicacearum]